MGLLPQSILFLSVIALSTHAVLPKCQSTVDLEVVTVLPQQAASKRADIAEMT